MSRKSPDRRPPCGKTSINDSTLWLGGCYQQQRTSRAHIPVLTNNTMVSPIYTGDPPTNPYGRPDAFGSPDCGAYFEYTCGDGVNGNLFCGIPPTSSVLAASPLTFSVGAYVNSYTTSSATMSLSQCQALGFKNVYASKMWHGRWSYDSPIYGNPDNYLWCCACGYQDGPTANDSTKYLSMSVDSTWDNKLKVYAADTYSDGMTGCGDYTFGNCCSTPVLLNTQENSAYASANSSVDSNSGNVTNTCSSGSSPDYCNLYPDYHYEGCDSDNDCYCQNVIIDGPPSCSVDHSIDNYYAGIAFGLLSQADTTNAVLLQKYCEFLGTMVVAPDVISGGGGSWHVEWHYTYQLYDFCGNPTTMDTQLTAEMTLTPTSLTIHTRQGVPGNAIIGTRCITDGYNLVWMDNSVQTWNVSGTSFSYTSTATPYGSWSFVVSTTETINGSLSGPYTSGQVLTEAIDMLGAWDMGDDAMYPWRTDSGVNKGPWVHRDETGPTSPSIPQCESYGTATGAIIGTPAPLGIDRVWSPTHPNWCACTDYMGCTTVYIDTYGAWSASDVYVPRATDWVDDWTANGLPQGALIMMNQFQSTPSSCNTGGGGLLHDDTVWVCKYAETINARHSINFARPCGNDRLQLSQSSERCISNLTDNVILIDSSSAQPLPSDTIFWVCGTSQDGLYHVSRDGDYQLTLTSCIISASALATSPIENCGSGMVGTLRWGLGVPGICGRIDVTAATHSNPITCSLLENATLVNGDTVTIANAVGGAINGSWTVTVIDQQNIALNGSSGASASLYGGNGQMYIAGATDWKWNDVGSKGNYSTIEWTFDYRDVAEYYRLLGVSGITASMGCDTASYCSGPTVPAVPRPNNSPCGLDQAVTDVNCQTHCLAYNACTPVVAYYAPAGQDHFTGSATNHGFGSLTPDSQYGSRWNAVIQQQIGDPFWQAPPCPCSYDSHFDTYGCNCGWRMDDGTCQTNQTDPYCVDYYPLVPLVESMNAVPAGAPALPAGIYLGCLNVSDLGGCPPSPAGNVCGPPYANTYDFSVGCSLYKPHVYSAPWVTYLNQYACVCADGVFAPQYEEDGIICATAPAP